MALDTIGQVAVAALGAGGLWSWLSRVLAARRESRKLEHSRDAIVDGRYGELLGALQKQLEACQAENVHLRGQFETIFRDHVSLREQFQEQARRDAAKIADLEKKSAEQQSEITSLRAQLGLDIHQKGEGVA